MTAFTSCAPCHNRDSEAHGQEQKSEDCRKRQHGRAVSVVPGVRVPQKAFEEARVRVQRECGGQGSAMTTPPITPPPKPRRKCFAL